jgi:hypothetical protein
MVAIDPAAQRIIADRAKHASEGIRAPVPPDLLVSLREGDDDHFYGPWKGGSKAEGGRPGSGGGTPGAAEGKGRWVEDPPSDSEVGWGGTEERLRHTSYASRFDGYGLKVGPDERREQMRRASELDTWEFRQGDEQVRRMSDAWADSTTTPKAQLVASSAVAAGLTDGMVWTRGDRMLAPSPESIAGAKAMYERTQRDLGFESVTLYRGVAFDNSSRNALESWTTDPTIAFDGAAVFRAEVPRAAVFMDMGHWGRGEEGEYVLLSARLPDSALSRVPVKMPAGYGADHFIGKDQR